MISRKFVLRCTQFVFPLIALITGALAASKGPTTPGMYRDWGGEVDAVTIIQTFRLDDYNDIAVESFDTSTVILPNPKENTYAAVKSAQGSIKPAFLEGFEKKLRQKPGPKAPRGQGKALIIRVKVTQMDPGSQAARYFGGFGAGAVRVAITGEMVDAASRKALIRFTQERRSGFGLFGGGYAELFDRTASQIGGDVAGLLNAF